MSNEVIVVAACTHRAKLLDEYERQLANAGVPFHLEHVELPHGAYSITMQWKIDFCRKMALQFREYKTIYVTDAWDVLFFGTRQDLIDKAPHSLIVAAERNCYPEAHRASAIHGLTPWKYANSQIAASVDFLIDWLDRAEATPDTEIAEQAWFNRRLAEGSDLVRLDDTTNLFYVVNNDLEDGSLRAKNHRPWNVSCDTYPNFLHFSGGCSTDLVRRMLA